MLHRSMWLIGFATLVIALGGYCLYHTNRRDALWKIVHEKCVPHWQSSRDPSPCTGLEFLTGEARGVAILKDLVGKAQFLAIPTARISGIESPELESPEAPDLLGAAWRARAYVSARLGKALPRDSIGLAMNATTMRSQDQAHVHIDCLKPKVRDLLKEKAGSIGETWSSAPLLIGGMAYSVRHLTGNDLTGINPFEIAAERLKALNVDLSRATVVIAGTGTEQANPGFALLLGLTDPSVSHSGHGEDLLDHSCRIAKAI